MSNYREGDGLLIGRRGVPWYDVRTQASLGYRVSRAIQRFTDSWSNHVAGVLDIHGTLVIVEADWDAVKIRPLNYYDDPMYQVKHLPYPGSEGSRIRIGEFWSREIFDNYDRGLIKTMARTILRGGIAALEHLQVIVNDQFWICSELFQEGWKAGGEVRFVNSNRIYVPADFDDLERILLEPT